MFYAVYTVQGQYRVGALWLGAARCRQRVLHSTDRDTEQTRGRTIAGWA